MLFALNLENGYGPTQRGEGGQKNSPQIADTGTFKVRNWAKIADGGGGGSKFKQFYAAVINVDPMQYFNSINNITAVLFFFK